MAVLSRLCKVGTIADSLGVYVPAKVFLKAIGFVRFLTFAYLLTKIQLDLWGLGMSLFTVAAPLLTFGSHHGLVRYASFYEVRGRLRDFYRSMRWRVPVLALLTTGLALAFSGHITRFFIAAKAGAHEMTHWQQLLICWAALANALMVNLYHNSLGILVGMRAYRLVAAVELVFSLLFAVLGIAVALVNPAALVLLIAHFLSLAAAVAAAVGGLELCLRHQQRAAGPPDALMHTEETDAMESMTSPDAIASMANLASGDVAATDADGTKGVFARVLRFGMAALPALIVWQSATYMSFWLIRKIRGMEAGGEFLVFLVLGQPIVFLADAAWAVIFTHVVKQWESGRREGALSTLQTAYKAVAMLMMALTVLLLLTSQFWVRILPSKFHHGLPLLRGLFMFFQVVIHLALLTILAKVHERPWVIAVAGLLSIATNVALALRWMERADYAPQAAAMAAGVGVYFGVVVVTLAYLLATGTRLQAATYAVLVAPAILLLPATIAGAIWLCVLLAAAFTPWVFSASEKLAMSGALRRIFGAMRRAGGT